MGVAVAVGVAVGSSTEARRSIRNLESPSRGAST
jgi:hypothetical protein